MSGTGVFVAAGSTASVDGILTWALLVVPFGFAGLWSATDTGRRWKTLAVTVGGVLVTLLVIIVLASGGAPGRGIGLLRALSALPGPVRLLFGLVTQLGDPWFLVGVAVLFYLVGTDRELVDTPREGAFVLAVTFGALALTDFLKSVFAVPRPPGAGTAAVPPWLPAVLAGTFRNITTGTGYAFPSGHALGSTAVFGALAYRLNVRSDRFRWTAAAVIVGAVCLSRVALGVHYAVDVTAGVLAGLALLGTAAWAGADRPLRTFAIAALLATGAVVAASITPHGTVWSAGQWLGAALGAGGTWFVVRPSCELGLRETAIVSAVVGTIWVGTYLLTPTFLLTVVATAVASALTVGAPSIAAALD